MKCSAVTTATTVMALGVLLSGCAEGVGYQPSYSYPLLGSFGFAGDWGGGWDHGHWNSGGHAELAHFHSHGFAGHGFGGHGFGGHGGGGGGHR